jgi:hypothetical protein
VSIQRHLFQVVPAFSTFGKNIKMKHDNNFSVGCVHRNGIGWYKIEKINGDEVVYRYLEGGKLLTCRRSLLAKIEANFLGYNLPSPHVSKQILERYGHDAAGWSETMMVTEAGRLIETERNAIDMRMIQTLYEDQLSRSGKQSGVIRIPTHRRESGCHKCKRTPLVSDTLYECPLCDGMVCRSCGSCLCNWQPKSAEQGGGGLPATRSESK